MYYYCYISESKVDQILSQYYKGIPERTTRSQSESETEEGDISASLFKFVDSAVKFGRDSETILSREIRESRVSKLVSAMRFLEKDIRNLNTVNSNGFPLDKLGAGVYSYRGLYKVQSLDNTYAYLTAPLSLTCSIKAVCSLQYFSDMGKDKDRFMPHSGNIQFFKGEFDLEFISLLYVIKNLNNTLHATPVFLALSLDSGVQL